MQLPLPLESDLRLPRTRDILHASFGPQCDEVRYDPTTQLFKSMMSSKTLDAVSDEAFRLFCISFPSWDMLIDADFTAVFTPIQGVKYAADKAYSLLTTARDIRARRGNFDLNFLARWPVEDGLSWLKRLRGVGPKVAAATLNFSTLRKRAFVVDTHVLRVSKRLGLLPPTANFKRGFYLLMDLLPNEWDADDLYELHWLMKMHGQRMCRHSGPLCRECPLARLCPSATSALTAAIH